MNDRFDGAQRIADAVLFEGYVLYPYRASAAKNVYRWQFGVVAPRAPREDGEPWFTQTECLVRSCAAARLFVRVRFLRPGGQQWLEGVPYSIDLDPQPIDMATTIPLRDAGIAAHLTIAPEPIDSFVKLRLRIENLEPWRAEFDVDRDAMLRRSLVGTHLLLAVEQGCFESMLDPAPDARHAVERCANVHTWPVLVADRVQRNLVLSSPIILYDFPGVAAESRVDLCDGAEIDEILSLRILTLTDEEKQQARLTDPRARDIVDRVESMTATEFAALHGTMRSADFFNPADTAVPEAAAVNIGGQQVRRGSRVTLRPNRRADTMDMFLRDQPATVAGVYRDVDDRVYVAVTVDVDPAATLHDSFGRYFYFDPAEVEPITTERESTT